MTTCSQAKKEKRFKPQKQKALIQPDLQYARPEEAEEGELVPEGPRRPSSNFFDMLEQVLQSPSFPKSWNAKYSWAIHSRYQEGEILLKYFLPETYDVFPLPANLSH